MSLFKFFNNIVKCKFLYLYIQLPIIVMIFIENHYQYLKLRETLCNGDTPIFFVTVVIVFYAYHYVEYLEVAALVSSILTSPPLPPRPNFALCCILARVKIKLNNVETGYGLLIFLFFLSFIDLCKYSFCWNYILTYS